MQCHTTVQGFTGGTEVDLALPCTYDFEVVGSRYLHALRDGDVPLTLLFSGTVFTRGATRLRGEQVPWDREARYQLPVAVWRRPDRRVLPAAAAGSGSTTTSLDALADYRARTG